MHTSGYLGDHLNTYTGIAGEPLHPEVLQPYEYTARHGGDTFRMLHSRALSFALVFECNWESGPAIQTPCMMLDRYWSASLSLDRLDYRVYGAESDVTLSVFGQVPSATGHKNLLSFDHVIRPGSVEVDNDFLLFPYEASGLCIDLLAGRYSLLLAQTMKESR